MTQTQNVRNTMDLKVITKAQEVSFPKVQDQTMLITFFDKQGV
jgi:hypothetical protein